MEVRPSNSSITTSLGSFFCSNCSIIVPTRLPVQKIKIRINILVNVENGMNSQGANIAAMSEPQLPGIIGDNPAIPSLA